VLCLKPNKYLYRFFLFEESYKENSKLKLRFGLLSDIPTGRYGKFCLLNGGRRLVVGWDNVVIFNKTGSFVLLVNPFLSYNNPKDEVAQFVREYRRRFQSC
jgi:hypothetical protein